VEVASTSSGVFGDGDQASGGGKVASIGVGGQVACGDKEFGAQDGANAGHGLDDGGLRDEGRRADAVTPAERVRAMLLWATTIIGLIDIVVRCACDR
jgi:hypothetical protein